jgi:hypothetical protein
LSEQAMMFEFSTRVNEVVAVMSRQAERALKTGRLGA